MTPRQPFARKPLAGKPFAGKPFAGKPPLHLAARFAAFLAVGLLAIAGVKSTVMQALAAAPAKVATACPMGMPDMPGMDMSSAPDKSGKSGGAPASSMANCPFCIASAHVALQTLAEPIPAPVSVAWIAPPPVADHSARGPPLVQPRARGPPSLLENV